MNVPVFDQNQAQIARAEYQLRRRQKQLEETRLRARTEVLGALTEVAYRRRQVELVRARSIRADEMARRGPRRRGDSMAEISARHLELTARRAHLKSIAKLREAEVDLQLALWGG